MATSEPRHPLIIALVKARCDAGLTQVEVAERLGVAGSTVCTWETGVRRPHLDTAAAWADAVGLRLALMVARATASTKRPDDPGEPWPHTYPPDDPRHLHDTDAAGNCKNPECGYLTDGTSADDERESRAQR